MAQPLRVPVFDNIKFLLITLVVLGHVLSPLTDDSHIVSVVFDFIYFFHMPAFIFISGLFAKRIYTREQGLNVNAIVYYFVLFFLLYTLLYVWQIAYGKSPKYNLFNIGSIPWYFFAMGGLSLSLPFFSSIRGKAKVVLPILVGIGVIVGFNSNFNDFLCLGRIVVYAPFYYAGYFLDINKMSRHLQSMHDRKVCLIAAIAFLAAVFIVCFLAPQQYIDGIRSIATAHNPYEKIHALSNIQKAGVRFIWYFLASMMIYSFCVIVPYKKLAITELGTRTMQVYFLHPFIYYPLSDLGFYESLIIPNMPISLILIMAFGLVLPLLLALPKTPSKLLKAIRNQIKVQETPN